MAASNISSDAAFSRVSDAASTVLAVDLGGSALKACLFTIDGGVIGTTSVPLAFIETGDGRSEQDPEVWWNALGQAVADIARQDCGGLARTTAVAICGFTRTQVFVDAEGNPVRAAIGFRDARAQEEVEAALAQNGIALHPETSHLNAFHPLARLAWLRRAEPSAWAATMTVLEPKDYLAFRLTGKLRSDHISQHRLKCAFTSRHSSLATALGIGRDVLPPLGEPADKVGDVRPDLPGALAHIAGAQVFCGSHDTWAAVAGMGALRPGRAYCISGSSEVFGLISDVELTAEGLVSIEWGRNIWQLGGPGQNGSNALAWIVDRLDRSDRPFARRLEDLLSQQQASNTPLIFHPFLHGERVPYWDKDLRASFLGLGSEHGPADLVRAVMEGVAFVNRVVLERAEQAAGRHAEEVRIGGGGSRSTVWNQIRANVLGRPVLASPVAEMGLAGCLALARLGLGIDDSLTTAADAVSPQFARFDPDQAQRHQLDVLFSVFNETHDAVLRASYLLSQIKRG